MAYLNDDVLDAALDVIADNATVLHICSQEPTTYTEATDTYSLGSASSPTVSAPANGSPDGRSVTIAAIEDGVVSDTGDATHWALVDGSRLLAAAALDASVSVTGGNDFTLTAFTVNFPDA